MGKKWKQWQILLYGLQIHCGGVCSHEIKCYLLLGRKAMTNLDSILKHRDITLPTKVHILSLVAQLCPTCFDPIDCSTPGLPVHHQLPEFTQTHVHWVGDAIQPSHPLSSPSIFPRIRAFSNESAVHIRWPKYWSFSFNISLSNEHSGLISFRMDWLDLLAVQRTLKSFI